MSVAVFQTVAACRAYRQQAGENRKIVFIPTMGALHEGHASLVRYGRETAGKEGLVLASIFVNPTQFGPNEDYGKYPRTLEADLKLMERAGADGVFAPAPGEMYSAAAGRGGGGGGVTVHPGPMAEMLEGTLRPGHFQGVCTVVAKLLHIARPTHLVMGQKDYQQQAILRQMIEDLNFPVELVRRPTVREADGLAMSSRNRYLSVEQRARAVGLYEALSWAKGVYDGGERNAETLHTGMSQRLAARGMEVQYALACHAQTLAPWHGLISGPCVLLAAVKLGTTRLIDNMILAEA